VKIFTDLLGLPFEHGRLVGNTNFLQILVGIEAFANCILEFLVNRPSPSVTTFVTGSMSTFIKRSVTITN
jgi:hypothetical protein